MADLDPSAAIAPSPPVTNSPEAVITGKPQEAPAPSVAPPPSVPPVADPMTAARAKSSRERLLSIADAENRVARRMVGVQDDMARRGEVLASAMPECYLKLVAGMRNAVRAFNAQLVDLPEYPLTRINWFETANVTLNDPTTGDGMRVRVSRKNSYFDLMLRMVRRSGKSDIPLIEGYGSLGRELIRTETLLRIEGWLDKGQLIFWVSLDFKRRSIPLEELPDRIVMAVASHDYTLLSRHFAPTLPEEDADDDNRPEVPIIEQPVVEPESPLPSAQNRQSNAG